MTESFYENLPIHESLDVAMRPENATQLPEDWVIVATDVIGSTRAIEAGRYKDVNTVGATSIIAVCNAVENTQVPFIFGGDGATLAIPPEYLSKVQEALLGVQDFSRRLFNLDLRVGCIPVKNIYRVGHSLGVARVKLAGSVSISTLSGSGWSTAEDWLKRDDLREKYHLNANGKKNNFFDLSGFECRWEPIASGKGQFTSFLIQCYGESEADIIERYLNVSATIQKIVGDEYSPIELEKLRLQSSLKGLQYEIGPKTFGRSWLFRLKYSMRVLFNCYIGKWLFKNNHDTEAVKWSEYRDDLINRTDFRKFDGVLRMVLDLRPDQVAEIEHYLAAEYKQGHLAYGMHHSSSALLTCFIGDYDDDHVHFLDGNDGGYALAAKQLKNQIKELSRRSAA